MELEVVDYLIIAAVIGLLIYAASAIYSRRDAPKPQGEIKIEIPNLSINQNTSTPKNITAKEPKAFDFRKLKLNRSDFEDAFANDLLHDVFNVEVSGNQANILLAVRTTDRAEKTDYYTIRLVQGSFINLEERLFGNTITRIDSDPESWKAFIEAAKRDDRDAMRQLLAKGVKISDEDIRIKLTNILGGKIVIDPDAEI